MDTLFRGAILKLLAIPPVTQNTERGERVFRLMVEFINDAFKPRCSAVFDVNVFQVWN